MKDLYLQLGIHPNAGQSDIETAFEQRPELASAEAILLNEPRRAAYNRTVSTVRSIGILRHRLELDNDNSWFVENYPDFTPRLHTKKYAAQAQLAAESEATLAASHQPGPASSQHSRSWLKVLTLGIGIAAVLLLLIFYL